MFACPEYLYLLIFIPIFLSLFILRLRTSDRLLRSHIWDPCFKVVIGSAFRQKQIFRYSVLLGFFLFLVLALARPQSQKEQKEVEIKGAEVMILADVSRSMLVEDMGGGFSRLDVVKKELDKLIGLLSGQRVGLISFAGSAILVSPLTLDHSILRLFLKSLSPQTHSIQGTDFGGAFRTAARALKRGSALESIAFTRIIIVASDGEDNERQVQQAVRELVKEKVRIFALGVGTHHGGMIPVYDREGYRVGYKKDRQGNPVVSRFDESALKKIASMTNGAFYALSPGSDIVKTIYSDVQAVGEDVVSYQFQNVYKEWYQYLLFMALFLGALYFLMGERKINKLQEWHGYLEKSS